MKVIGMHRFIACIAALTLVLPGIAAEKLEVRNVTVEYAPCPVTVGTTEPIFGWQISSTKGGTVQKEYRIVVSSSEEKLASGDYDLWDSKKISSGRSVAVPYAGKTLGSRDECWWKVFVKTNNGKAESEPACFRVGLLDGREWTASWIGTTSEADRLEGHVKIPARYFRKAFRIDARIVRATLYICGLGSYEAYVNGEKIGEDEVLAPTLSEYDKTVYYNTYDVTDLVTTGRNAIGVVLGGGRYTSMRLGANDGIPDIKHYDLPKLIAQLEVTYNGGETDIIGTDASWKCTAEGPIRYSSEFDGEFYDARAEIPEFANPFFNDRKWADASIFSAPIGTLTPQPNPNIRIQDRIVPVSVSRKGDRFILDMGQNMVGWLQIKAHGTPGDTLTLRFSESLQSDGNLYTENLRNAEVTDRYVIRDRRDFVWHPTFTYHGFRFVEVSGLSYEPVAEDFEGQVFYDRMATTGVFETSDPTINEVFGNAFRGIRGNYRGMPTDCPQRDERMGWLGDRTTGCYGESYVFDNHLLYAKWNRDIRETQRPSGQIPDVCPAYWQMWSDNMTWPGAFLTTADMIWQRWGDTRPIRDGYDAMKLWMGYMKEKYGDNGIITKDTYGDWCMPPESLGLIHSKDPSRITEGALISTAFYYRFCKMMSRFAVVSGNREDAAYFEDEAALTRKAFNDKFFFKRLGYYSNNTVTANILPLYFGMVPEGYEEKVFGRIVEKTEKDFGGHVSVGVVGIQQLMRALTEFGRLDMAVRMATDTTYPSWGYMAQQGATTIWELWNGNTAAPAMNSGNHVMILGDLLVWYFEYLGGIKPAEPGYKRIRLQPWIPDELDYVKCSYDSIYGPIQSFWKKQDGKLTWKFTIPANTTAEVHIPGEKKAREYGSGTYTVVVKLK